MYLPIGRQTLFFFCPVLPFEPLRLITTKSLTRYLLHSYCVVQLASSFVNEVQLQRGSFPYKGAHFPPTLAHLNTRKLHPTQSGANMIARS